MNKTVLPRLAVVLAVMVLASPRFSWAQANLENPAPSSSQSGIGIVSGWKCTGGTLTFTVDNGPPAQLAYGTSRLDTQSVCGHSKTGFAFLINWNLLGNGQHTLRAFDNGVQFASVTFNVTTLGTEFLTGVSGSFELQDFPQPGKSVTVRWQQSAQNFVITGVGPGGDGGGGGDGPITCSGPHSISGLTYGSETLFTDLGSSCFLRIKVTNPTSVTKAFDFGFDAFNAAGSGIAFTVLGGILPPNSTASFVGIWVTPSAKSISCSAIASCSFDPALSSVGP